MRKARGTAQQIYTGSINACCLAYWLPPVRVFSFPKPLQAPTHQPLPPSKEDDNRFLKTCPHPNLLAGDTAAAPYPAPAPLVGQLLGTLPQYCRVYHKAYSTHTSSRPQQSAPSPRVCCAATEGQDKPITASKKPKSALVQPGLQGRRLSRAPGCGECRPSLCPPTPGARCPQSCAHTEYPKYITVICRT